MYKRHRVFTVTTNCHGPSSMHNATASLPHALSGVIVLFHVLRGYWKEQYTGSLINKKLKIQCSSFVLNFGCFLDRRRSL